MIFNKPKFKIGEVAMFKWSGGFKQAEIVTAIFHKGEWDYKLFSLDKNYKKEYFSRWQKDLYKI